MSMVAKVASLLEKVLGAQTEVLAEKHGALHWGQFQHSSPRRNADGVPRLRWHGRELCRGSQDSSAVGSQDGCVAASID